MQNHWIHDWERALRKALPNVTGLLDRDLVRIRDIILSRDIYVFRSTKLKMLAEEIAEEIDILRLSKLLWQVAVSSGFQNASLFVLEQGTGAQFKSRVCSSYSEKWRQRYIERKYQFIDPVVRLAATHHSAFKFSEAKGDSQAEIEFWLDAGKHGAGTNGLAIPMRLECGALLVATFATSLDIHLAGQRCDEHLSDLTIVARIAAEAFGQLGRNQPAFNESLSQDELRYLYILAASDEPANARLLKTTFGSIKSIEHSIREKLGVKTILQAVAIASKQNFFDKVDFSADDVNPLCNELGGWDLLLDDKAKSSRS